MYHSEYDVQCKECLSQNLIEEYEGAPLTCTNCGLVGGVEKVPDVDDLDMDFKSFHVEKDFQLEQDLIKMAEELARQKEQERKEKFAKADVADLMGGMKIGYKKYVRSRKRRKNPY